jgi:HK97 gp10 family phage protein
MPTLNAGQVIGNRRLQEALRKIPYAVKKDKFMMAAFRQAAKPIIQAARSKINNIDGDLKKSIKAFSTRAGRRVPLLYVGPKATGGSSTKNEQRGGGYYGAIVEYGSATANPSPFMRPAWDASQGNAEAILLKGVQAIVQKVLMRETKGLKQMYK